MGTTLSTVWTARILPDFRKRFSGWPTSGAVDVTIAGYSDVNGSSAALATAMAWESLMRDVEINPRVAVVATWTEKGALATHSHLPDMLIGYGRNWSDILLVGPGSSAKVADAAVRGYLLPLVSTQVIEVRNYAEAMDIATGKIEVKITSFAVDSAADVLPMQVAVDADYGEETRLRYRFLDLRRAKMQANLLLRSKIGALGGVSNHLAKVNFTQHIRLLHQREGHTLLGGIAYARDRLVVRCAQIVVEGILRIRVTGAPRADGHLEIAILDVDIMLREGDATECSLDTEIGELLRQVLCRG